MILNLPDAVTKFAVSSLAASTGTTEEFADANAGPIPAIRHSKGCYSGDSRHCADQKRGRSTLLLLGLFVEFGSSRPSDPLSSSPATDNGPGKILTLC